ncbi:ABC transporter permease, partial [Streptomyces sp. SID89]|nr:ABC transporter permease [Streptomyces sp. SID89]
MSEVLAASEAAATDVSVPAAPGARPFWRRLRAQRA